MKFAYKLLRYKQVGNCCPINLVRLALTQKSEEDDRCCFHRPDVSSIQKSDYDYENRYKALINECAITANCSSVLMLCITQS